MADFAYTECGDEGVTKQYVNTCRCIYILHSYIQMHIHTYMADFAYTPQRGDEGVTKKWCFTCGDDQVSSI